MKKILSRFGRRSPASAEPAGTSLKETLRNKYLAFQNLLVKNNHVLELMAELEENRSGTPRFDRKSLHAHADRISDGVRAIIDSMNALSHGKYPQLYDRYSSIVNAIEGTFRAPEIEVSPFTIPLEQTTRETASVAGGKMAHLGEVRNRVRLPTPDGFSISAYAFKRFMDHNHLAKTIAEHLTGLDIEDLHATEAASGKIRQLVMAAEIPQDVQDEIEAAIDGLRSSGGGGDLLVSVRSSALYEDGEFSFAGQYSSFLNVPKDRILGRYREVLASLFTTRAIFYRRTKGFSEDEMAMAVGVLQMVDAQAAGVAYSRDPNEPKSSKVVLNALRGLGLPVVDGTQEPHSFSAARDTGAIMESRTPEQRVMLVSAPDGFTRTVDVPVELRSTPCLTEAEVRTLSEYAVLLEEHYGEPQDIEWAVGADGRIAVLQSRPLRMRTVDDDQTAHPARVEGHAVLLDAGVVASKGIGSGPAFIHHPDGDLADFPDGAVLVAHHTSTKFVTVMNKASAIITDVGGATGHMAALCREYQVPAFLDTGHATTSLKHGQMVTVDAVRGCVYEGTVDDLIRNAPIKRASMRTTHLASWLERVTQLILPLNLVDPDRENFTPDHCETFHDITRFVHEMAMAEIFKTGKGQKIDSFEDIMSAVALVEAGDAARLGEQTSRLILDIPMEARLLDIDGGIRKHTRKVTVDDILSIPFSAFITGLRGMRWPQQRIVNVKGRSDMIAHTATAAEEQRRKKGDVSYALLSRNYMNFSILLGYHFSMVEAYAGEHLNDNYIKFFFKGGGSVLDRKLRRVRLIRAVLKKMGFRVNEVDDVIDATLTKYRQSTIEQKLEVMGRLTVYTKQLDMAMYDDAVTDMFMEEFVDKYLC